MHVRGFIPVLFRLTLPGAFLCAVCGVAQAQLSLSSAVNLALQNSPKVKVAEADVERARAALSETRDAFIPTVGVSGGIGKSSGPPLSVPQVFTISAQSLIFNFSERDYIRAAHAGLAAAQLSLEEARNTVTEDVVNTYIGLDSAVQRQAAARQAQTVAERLGEIVQGRFDAGVDAHIEVTRAHRTGLQIQRQELAFEDEADALSEHLSNLVGLRLTGSELVHGSIPVSFPQGEARVKNSPGLRAAQASAENRMYMARAESRYLFRPQLSFGATYSYISTAFTNYDIYYTAFNRGANVNPNALNFGVQVTVPLLDFAHRARTREAIADAKHSRWDAEDQRTSFIEGNGKSLRARKELVLGAELARANRDLAQDELDAVLVQLQPGAPASSTGSQLSPKDEQNARLQVQQRTLDMLNAELQVDQTEVNLMRQDGTLGGWVRSSLTGVAAQALPAGKP